MDVERIQKINNLALDLMKQGLASDREQAVAQAEKILGGRGTEDYTEMREQMGEIKKSKEEEQTYSTTQKPSLSAVRVEQILQKNTEYIVRKLRQFQEKIETLETDLANLKARTLSLETLALKEVVTKSKQQQSVLTEEAPETQQVQPQSGQKLKKNPRSGNYAEDDVSIEKIFYMGSR